MEIAVENVRCLHNAGNLRAFCDVRLKTTEGDWIIRGCRIIQQTEQKAWFSLPVISWENGTGGICYKTVLELPAGLKSKISESALEMYYEIPNVKVDDVRTGIRNRYDAGFSAPTRRLANHLGGADGGADEY
jgi:hypothetical protein